MSNKSLEDLTLGVMFKAARLVLGMSLADMGKQMGVSSVSVKKWESGEVPLKAITYHAMQCFFTENGIEFELDAKNGSKILLTNRLMQLLVKDAAKPPYKTMSEIYASDVDPETSELTKLGLSTDMTLEQIIEEIKNNPGRFKTHFENRQSVSRSQPSFESTILSMVEALVKHKNQ